MWITFLTCIYFCPHPLIMIDTKNIWRDCLETIRIQISPAIFSTWFAQTHITEIKKKNKRLSITVGCTSSYIKQTIETRYFGLIKETLSKNLELPCDLGFIVKEVEKESRFTEKDSPLFITPDKKSSSKDSIIRAKLRPNFTFQNFAVSSSNQMAWAAADAISKSPGTAYNPLFIWGGVGVGKTHLMNAVGVNVMKSDDNKKVFFVTGENFTNDIIEGIRKKTTQQFRDKYRKLDALLIDDIQFIAGKDAVQEEFFHTFNALVGYGSQIVLTSDRPPQEISKLEERLRSRFEAGLIVDIANPDFELRCAIVQIKSKEKGVEITMPLVQMIAGNIESARKIEGFLIRLVSETKLKGGGEVTEDVVRSILGKNGEEEKISNKVSPGEVLKAICDYYSIGKRQILGSKRTRSIALPRQVLMYILRTQLRISLSEIGQFVGGRDHTTVMHAVDKITTLNSTNVEIREDITGIKQQL